MQIEGKMVVEDLRHLAAGLPSGEYEVLIVRTSNGVVSKGKPKQTRHHLSAQEEGVVAKRLSGGEDVGMLASEYGVSRSTIYRIRRGSYKK